MKICNALFDDRLAGPSARVILVARQLRESGWETNLCLPAGTGNAEQAASAAGVPVERIRLARMPDLKSPVRLIRWGLQLPGDVVRVRNRLCRIECDIVHVNGAFFLAPAVAAKLTRAKLVWHLNDTIVPRPLSDILGVVVRVVADRVVVAAGAVAHHYGIPRRAVTTISAPVDVDRFTPRPPGDENRKQACIGLVANWTRIKGLETFVESAERVRNHHRLPVRAVIAGAKWPNHADYISRVERRIDELGMRDVIEDRGMVDDVAALLHEIDVLVLSSTTEACPMVVLEAMASGVPVVATDVGAVREMLDAGSRDPAGLVVPPRDPGAMAEALSTLLVDADRRTRMGAAGRRRAVENYSLASCARRHDAVYREVLGLPSGANLSTQHVRSATPERGPSKSAAS